MSGRSEVFTVLRQLYLAGLWIERTADGALAVRGGVPSEDLQVQLRGAREAIHALLRDQPTGPDTRYVVPVECIARRACPALGPCAEALMQRSCDRARDGPHVASNSVKLGISSS